MKACARCGVQFEPSHKGHLHCGNKCRWAASRERLREVANSWATEQRRVALDGDARPWGRWSTREKARDALYVCLAWDRGWWGEPMVRRWAETHRLTFEAAQALLTDLGQLGHARSRVSGTVQWRAA